MEEQESPFKLGYRMPAEWAEHEATWIAWPKDPLTFPEELLPDAEDTYMRMIGTLQENENVQLLVDNANYENKVRMMIEKNHRTDKNLLFNWIETGDVWFRDYGPIFIERTVDGKKEIAFTHWEFNAWGKKYDELLKDTHIPEKLPIQEIKHFKAPMVLEGGSIDVNGLGTCLTTEQCLLNKNRNPQLSREQIEQNLKNYLGATNIIWLGNGIAGDDTDGHVDDLARFVNPDTVVCAFEEDQKDDNYAPLKANYDKLKAAKDQNGKALNVVQLPMPKAVVYEGQRLPASYTNFYIANRSVLVPIFKDDNDKKALSILQKMFPDKKVIGIDCRALVYGFGAIHCVTQQQPKG